MKMFGMCIDKRVVVGVAGVGLLLWVLAPEAVVTVLPFLLIAICPLSMLLMMKMMNADGQAASGPPASAALGHTEAAAPEPSASGDAEPTGPGTDAESAADARWN
jgi:hypothetical protein